MNATQKFPVLVGDIGGTNARFAILQDIHSSLEYFEPQITRQFNNLHQLLEKAVYAKTAIIPERLLLGVAGPITGTEYPIVNANWSISPQGFVDASNFNCAEFMNDFSAQALGVLTTPRDEMKKTGTGEPIESNVQVVIGPGTGFGMAIIVPFEGRSIILPSEGSCADLGLGTNKNADRELDIQRYLTKTYDRQMIEYLVSGAGLENIYQAIEKADDVKSNKKLSAAQISNACRGKDERACEAVSLFAKLLGQVAGNIALTTMARGGVYISGGMASKMYDLLVGAGFRQAFDNKDPQRELIRSIPTYFINNELAAVEGLASYAKTPDRFDLGQSSQTFFPADI